MHKMNCLVLIAGLVIFVSFLGCDDPSRTDNNPRDTADGDTDTGGDGDSDADGDADSDGDSDTDTDTEMVWVEIEGGTYSMGSEDDYVGWATPIHEVDVPTFEINRTEITVGQYRQCVDAGGCEWPYIPGETDLNCNNFAADRESYPMNCMSWNYASIFCSWAGARLPTEAEWEYAARSRGKDVSYAWGDEPATCDLAVMDETISSELNEESEWGCETGMAFPVCSKPLGNTEQGLCDMTGNLWEMVEDWFHESYDGAPTDGSAFNDPATDSKVRRGGSYTSNTWNWSDFIHVSYRTSTGNVSGRGAEYGFRCAR